MLVLAMQFSRGDVGRRRDEADAGAADDAPAWTRRRQRSALPQNGREDEARRADDREDESYDRLD